VSPAILQRLKPRQIERAFESMAAQMDSFFPGPHWEDPFIAALRKLDAAQTTRLWDLLLVSAERPRMSYFPIPGTLSALSLRVDQTRVTRAADRIIVTLNKSPKKGVRMLVAFAPRLAPEQSEQAWEAIVGTARIETAEMFEEYGPDDFACDLKAFVPRLSPAKVGRMVDSLSAELEEGANKDFTWNALCQLLALAPRVSPERADRVWKAVVAARSHSTDPWASFMTPEVLRALGARLTPAQLELNAIAAMRTLPRSRLLGTQIFRAIAPSLQPKQFEECAGALTTVFDQTATVDEISELTLALGEFAPKFTPEQAKRAWDALIPILGRVQRKGNVAQLERWEDALVALASRLATSQIALARDEFVRMLENSETRAGAVSGLVAVTRHQESAEVARNWEALDSSLERLDVDVMPEDSRWSALIAVAQRLDPEQRDRLSLNAITSILNCCSELSADTANGMGGWKPSVMGKSIRIAAFVSTPRPVARLLSHPACVGHQRECLLERFEELVFYGGKPVFVKPEVADDKRPADGHSLPRRFHNLHEAAAWIQQNWPDFDLETNCPVTWRGSR
jgi:hypothetical protein